MKTNMKLKSTLWALAFAVAAVSCSDDLEENGGDTGITAEDGEGVYLTVNIASPSGQTTKAPNDPNWSAENGDGFEQGTVDERKVNDINIYLIKASDAVGTTAISSLESGLKVVNAAENTPIEGHGFSKTVMENAHDASIHHTANTVRLTVNEVPSQATVYHVLAVANFGKEVNFSTLGELRDAMEAPAGGADWVGNAFTTATGQPIGLATKTDNFVMSTHKMWDVTLGTGSSVTISPDNMDENNPAQATVFIERLAARIDVGLTDALVGKGDVNSNGDAVKNPIKVEGSTNTDAKDYVKLTGYQVVNRWNGDNYLLKRVTANLTGKGTGATATYPPITIDESTNKISYLGDEVWNNTSNTFNYVIDPYTTGTTAKSATNMHATDYESHYDADLNSNISTDFVSVSGITTTANSFTAVSYTKENCLNLNNQIMGLVTGIIFQGEYKPSAVSEFDEDGGDDGNTATVKANPYTAKSDFYIVNDFAYDKENDENVYRYLAKDLTTIGALSFSAISESKKAYASDLLKALFGSSNAWGTVKLENLQEAVSAMEGGKLNIEYKEYLQSLITPATGTVDEISDITVANAKWSAFLTSQSITDPGTVNTDSDKDAYAESSKALYDNWNVSFYKGGVCYFPYWIRHEDNGVNSLAGPMEFCIVRNNVYQVGVSGVNALGYPLPFVTDPTTPVEEENVFLQVQIYVKDWTLRKASGIIL